MTLKRTALVFSIGLLTTLVGAVPVYALIDIGSSSAIDGVATDQGTFFGFGQATSLGEIGFGYKPAASHNICSVSFALEAAGSPTDAVSLQLFIGTTTASGTHYYLQGNRIAVSDSDIQVRNTSAFAKTTFTFTPCAIVVGANEYFFVLNRDGSTSDTNYYRTTVEASPPPTFYGTGTFTAFLTYNNGAGSGSKTNYISGNGMDVALGGTENYGVSAPSSTPSFAASIFAALGAVSESNASSTIAGNLGAFTALHTNLLTTKWPFNWIGDLANDFDDFSKATSTTFFDLSFTFPMTGTSTGVQWIPQTWTFLSSSTVSTYLPNSTRIAFRYLVAVLVTALWCFQMYRRITSITL